MRRAYVLIAVLVASALLPAQNLPSFPKLPPSLDGVCLNDTAFAPYFQLLLDTLAKMDTSGSLKRASVKKSCDTVRVVVPFGILEIPVFQLYKMGSCSLRALLLDPSSTTALRDSVITVCRLAPMGRSSAPVARAEVGRISVCRARDGAVLIGVGSDVTARTSVRIADASGRLVRALPIGASGLARWDGRDAAGAVAPPGLYACSVSGGPGIRQSASFVK